MVKIEEKYKSTIIELEARSKQCEEENASLKENLAQLNKEKSSLDKKCSTVIE